MGASKTVVIRLCAGTGWNGHVFFRVTNPSNVKDYIHANHLSEVRKFCNTIDCEYDESIEELLHLHLVNDSKKGWMVPESALGKTSGTAAAERYLNKIQANFF
jgi:hypothetical protein